MGGDAKGRVGSDGRDGSRGERDCATSDGRGDPGREEDRLRRGGDQADSQSASEQALDDFIFTKYEVDTFGDSNMLEKNKRGVFVKTLTITFMVKLLCYLFLW